MMLKVYGHPRSGNNYIMALLALNFYPDKDVSTGGGYIGHWAKRVWIHKIEFGKLAGHHRSPAWGYDPTNSIYVYRDGRAVIASLYRTQQFVNPEWEGMEFSDFIRRELDWQHSPGRRIYPGHNIIEHWLDHLEGWEKVRIHKVQYERAVCDAGKVLELIAHRFGLPAREKYEVPSRLVGWFPSGGMLTGWRELWNEEDTAYFFGVVGEDFWGVWDGCS